MGLKHHDTHSRTARPSGYRVATIKDIGGMHNLNYT